MPVDLTALNAAVQAANDEATKTETTDAAVIAILNGQAAAITKAVTDALTADAAANQASIDAAVAAINTVNARFVSADNNLGAAVTANTPSA